MNSKEKFRISQYLTKKNSRGITLVSLVITVIVLLILSTITINALNGDNGILKRATEAKENTQISQEKEIVQLAVVNVVKDNKRMNQSNLQSEMDKQYKEGKTIVSDNGDSTFSVIFVDSNREYDVVSGEVKSGKNWSEIKQNAKAPEEQKEERNNGVIGIGTDGKSVNMDLWEYTLKDGTYTLNDIDDINDTNGANETKGYLGKIIDGKIQGTVPMYIKAKTDKDFVPVTSLRDTFINLKNDFDDFVTTPEIPSTVTNMQSTFSRCGKLVNITNLPPKLESLKWTFYKCTSLENFNQNIPDTVTTMEETFLGCGKLANFDKELPKNLKTMKGTFLWCEKLKAFDKEIPEGVTNMRSTFDQCKSLERFNSSIPESVTNMYGTFSQCKKLTNINIVVPKNVTNLQYTFGDCQLLNGTVEINASVTGKILDGNSKIDYFACFRLWNCNRK